MLVYISFISPHYVYASSDLLFLEYNAEQIVRIPDICGMFTKGSFNIIMTE